MSKFFVMLSDGEHETELKGVGDQEPEYYDDEGFARAIAAGVREELSEHGTRWRGVHVLLCKVVEDFGEV